MHLTLIVTVTSVVTGCSIVFPAHRNSYDIEGEKVELRLLTEDELCNKPEFTKLKLRLTCPFPRSEVYQTNESDLESGTASVATAGAVASAAIDVALDFVQDELKEDAKRYEAQFERKLVSGNFWKGRYPQYAGFEMIRRTLKTNPDPAFRFIAAFEDFGGEAMFKIRPIYLYDASTKAKVLAKYRSVASWFDWFVKAVDEVEIVVHVELEQIYLDRNGKIHVEKILASPLKFSGYSIENPKEIVGDELNGVETDVFPGVRKSAITPTKEKEGNGVFRLMVRVTEKDPSNAAKFLHQGAKLVADNESKLKAVEKMTNDDGDK